MVGERKIREDVGVFEVGGGGGCESEKKRMSLGD